MNNDDTCFQYAATVALNHKGTGKNLQRISKINPFISKYNLKGINHTSWKDYWKKFEKNSPKKLY